MQLSFTPMRRDDQLSLSKSSDVLTINGEDYDFSPLQEGQTLLRADASCDWLASDVERVNGQIQLTLILPHGANALKDTLFPQPLIASDGPVPVPLHSQSEEPTT